MRDKRLFDRLLKTMEDLWLTRSALVCALLGVLCGLLYYFGLVNNFRGTAMGVTNFASIIIGITGVFLTLLITLKESPLFSRLREYFPPLQNQLYLSLRNQIFISLAVVVLSFAVNVLPPSPSIILSSFGVAVWFGAFWFMVIGAFYTVHLIIDLVVRNIEIPVRNSRR